MPQFKTDRIALVLGLALAAALAISLPAWQASRAFPIVPVFWELAPWFSFLGPALWALLLLASLFFSAGIARSFAGMLLIALIGVSALLDQTLLQPWLFQYALMILILGAGKQSLAEGGKLRALRLIMAAVYFWSGVAKFTPEFFAAVFPWFIEPISSNFALSTEMELLLAVGVALTEMFGGVALLMGSRVSTLSAIFLISMHLFVLAMLGPLGHWHNSVVWPWNLAMIFFLWELFIRAPAADGFSLKADLRALILAVLLIVGPCLSQFCLWDSYLSFALYSGNIARMTVSLSQEQLSQSVKGLASEETHETLLSDWSFAELKLPVYPEERVLKVVAKAICERMGNDPELIFRLTPKHALLSRPLQSQELDCTAVSKLFQTK